MRLFDFECCCHLCTVQVQTSNFRAREIANLEIKWFLLAKLFWPTVRKKCSSNQEKLLKFKIVSGFRNMQEKLEKANLCKLLIVKKWVSFNFAGSQNILICWRRLSKSNVNMSGCKKWNLKSRDLLREKNRYKVINVVWKYFYHRSLKF